MACGIITQVAFELFVRGSAGRIEMGWFAEREAECFATGLLLFLIHLAIRPQLIGFLLWLIGGVVAIVAVLYQFPP
jgi:predicted metal-binding membrane protein